MKEEMKMETETIKNNSEILFLYDAKNTNPNGDMDDDNKPRMDKFTKTNLVSDVRLKRYVRDYLHDFKGKEIFVNNDADSAKEKYKKANNNIDEAKEKWIDVRFFGIIPTQDEAMGNTLVGPIQFNWGYSLNKVDLLKSKTITSKWANQQGVGKDFRVKYSLIAFSGSINKVNAEKTGLTEDDLKLFDEAMLKSIPLSRTRSKIGQWPRFYLRIVMNDGMFLKDLRELIHLKNEEELTGIEDVKLDISELLEYLNKNNDNIEKIIYFVDDKIKLFNDETELDDLNGSLGNFSLEELKINE